MAARFRSLRCAPFNLRPLLRATLQPGEHLVGWAVAEPSLPTPLSDFVLAFQVLPAIGPLLGLTFRLWLGPKPVLLVLTDRHLLIIRVEGHDWESPRIALAEQRPVETLDVRPAAWGMGFALRRADGSLQQFLINISQSAPAARLGQGLALCARPDPLVPKVATTVHQSPSATRPIPDSVRSASARFVASPARLT